MNQQNHNFNPNDFEESSDSLKNQYLQQLGLNQNQQLQNFNLNNPSLHNENPFNALSPLFLQSFANNASINESQVSNPSEQPFSFADPDLNSFTNSSFASNIINSQTQAIPINSKLRNFDNRNMNQTGSPFTLDYDANTFTAPPNPHSPSSQFDSSKKFDMFSPLIDEVADISPANSYKPHNMASALNNYLLLELQNIVGSPPTSPSYYSTSLPTMNVIARNMANLGNPPELQTVVESSPFVNSFSFQSSGLHYSPGSPFPGNLDSRDTEMEPRGRVSAITEKRRRRRESHNAVERRRRDNINEQIQELYSLLPASMKDPGTKPNKGLILRKSVAYIKELLNKNPDIDSTMKNSGGHSNSSETNLSQSYNPNSSSGLAAMLNANEYTLQTSTNNNSYYQTGMQTNQENKIVKDTHNNH
ncbi:hypothetical protein BB558_007025 [Smittium angustum]|uniref:BHLH domain-containing protein n=1 Tax=Smittium angustum TaxID=133377 RepID=A0A2U1IW59_SMIAN|nr:hypothetical protein BB558_007025 [Smittium angustum]